MKYKTLQPAELIEAADNLLSELVAKFQNRERDTFDASVNVGDLIEMAQELRRRYSYIVCNDASEFGKALAENGNEAGYFLRVVQSPNSNMVKHVLVSENGADLTPIVGRVVDELNEISGGRYEVKVVDKKEGGLSNVVDVVAPVALGLFVHLVGLEKFAGMLASMANMYGIDLKKKEGVNNG